MENCKEDTCTCEGTIFTDSMCVPCLRTIESTLINKIEKLQEQIDNLDSDLDQVQGYLNNHNLSGRLWRR